LTLVASFALVTSNADGRASVTWKRFVDPHGSSVDVPISLVRQKAAQIGLEFQSLDRKTKIDFFTTTESRPGFPGNDPQGDMNLRRSDCDTWPPSYLAIKERVAAYSCTKGGKVNYYLSKYAPYGSVTLEAEYPVNQKALWDPIVSRIAASMHQVPRSEVR
jgi:hypothetical protein